jgi:hypothetical protein
MWIDGAVPDIYWLNLLSKNKSFVLSFSCKVYLITFIVIEFFLYHLQVLIIVIV